MVKYYEVTFRCIHGGKNFKSRGTGVRESICPVLSCPVLSCPGGKNFKSRGTGVRESIYLSIEYLPACPALPVKHVFIKSLQIKTRRIFELRLSTSVHLLENLKQNNLTFSKTCAF